jgi:hypothetical protein
MIRTIRSRLDVLSLLTAGSLAAGCSDAGGNGTGAGSSGDPAKKTLSLMFAPVMYSAYDGEHDFKLPVIATNTSGTVTFKATDESFVDITPTADGAMLTTRKAGTTTIIGTASDGTWGESTLVITQAAPADYELGRERYNNGVAAFSSDGGAPMGPPGGGMFMPDPESACTFCHRPDGTAGSGTAGMTMIDVEHTPQQTGGYSDQQLVAIFTQAQKPNGAGSRVIPLAIWTMLHKWNVEADVEKGIVVYLRSLEPKAQGEIDFGGLMRPGFDGGPPTGAGELNAGADAGS